MVTRGETQLHVVRHGITYNLDFCVSSHVFESITHFINYKNKRIALENANLLFLFLSVNCPDACDFNCYKYKKYFINALLYFFIFFVFEPNYFVL